MRRDGSLKLCPPLDERGTHDSQSCQDYFRVEVPGHSNREPTGIVSEPRPRILEGHAVEHVPLGTITATGIRHLIRRHHARARKGLAERDNSLLQSMSGVRRVSHGNALIGLDNSVTVGCAISLSRSNNFNGLGATIG